MKKRNIKTGILAVITASAMIAAMLAGCGASILKEEESKAESAQSDAGADNVAVESDDFAESGKSVEEALEEIEAAPETAEESAAESEEALPAEEVTEEAPEEAQGEETLMPEGGKALSVRVGGGTFVGYDSTETNINCMVAYPLVNLTGDDEIRYSALENALEAKNEKYTREANTMFENLKAAADADPAAAEGYEWGYSDQKDFSVVRADDRILSLCGHYTTFTGGAHGGNDYISLNLDSETGKELALRDISKDAVALVDTIKEALKEKYPDYDIALIDSADMVSEGIADSKAWTLGYDGFSMWFGAGDISAYAVGTLNVTIPYAGNEALFAEKYLPEKINAGYELFEDYADLDVDGDGDLEHLELYPESDEDWYFDKMKIDLDGEIVTEKDLMAYGFDSSIIRMDGKTYLYIQYSGDNDGGSTSVYDLTGGKPVLVDSTGFIKYRMYDQDTACGYRYALTDPEYTIMGIDTSVLGSALSYSYMRVSGEGIPQIVDGIYLNTMASLKLKQDIEGELIDPATGESAGTKVLKAGSECTAYKSDLTSSVIVTTEDGEQVRFEYKPGVPSYVNGIDTDEVFEGIMYAG